MSVTGVPLTSSVVLDAFCTLTYAENYINNRLNTLPWDDATDTNKTRALNVATLLIDKLNFKFDLTAEGQDHEFPRNEETDVPDDIMKATVEIALQLLDDYDPDELRNEVNISEDQYASVKTKYQNNPPHYILAGIPSAMAWDYLVPFLRDCGAIRMNRIS